MYSINPIGAAGEGTARHDDGVVPPPDDRHVAELEEDLEVNRARVDGLEEQEADYDDAKDELVHQVGVARTSLKTRLIKEEQAMVARGETPKAIKEHILDETENAAADVAARLMHKDRTAIMKVLLKDVPMVGLETRGKFERLIMIGLNMHAWDTDNYAYRLKTKTEEVDEGFKEEQKALQDELNVLSAKWNKIELEPSQG